MVVTPTSSPQSHVQSLPSSRVARDDKLPTLQNQNGSSILRCGFVECPSILSIALCKRLSEMPLVDAAVISNAVQKEVIGSLCAEVEAALQASGPLRDAVSVVFGTALFEVCMVLVLKSEPHAPPQIAHADDHRIKELFGVVQLHAGQCPTEGMPYNAEAVYPTDIAARCGLCGAQMLLPDRFARQREHLRECWTWTCDKAGRCCSTKRRKTGLVEHCDKDQDYDTEDDDDERLLVEFNSLVLRTFQDLLRSPEKVTREMRCLGVPDPAIGDGIVALPTLIHRGPGSGEQERKVLFFSIRPLYKDLMVARCQGDASVPDNDEHDYSEQIHASWLLARMSDDDAKARVRDTYARLGHVLDDFE